MSTAAPSGQKLCQICGAPMYEKSLACPSCGAEQVVGRKLQSNRDKTLATLLAILLGGIGAHKFYLGQIGLGVLYLIFCWTFIPAIIGFIEGLIYLGMTEQQFALKYGGLSTGDGTPYTGFAPDASINLSEATNANKTSRRLIYVLVIFAACIFFCVVGCLCLVVIGVLFGEEQMGETDVTVSTANGTFEVPSDAFLTERDLTANPPFTLMNINVWDAAVDRDNVVCTLPHGQQVRLHRAYRDEEENRYYFRISSGSCAGWVFESVISPTYQEPVGEQMQ